MDREKLVEEVGQHFKIAELTRELAQASDKIVELVNEVGQLKEALYPFARETVYWSTYQDDEPLVEAFPGYEGELTVGDLRRAFKAYYKPKLVNQVGIDKYEFDVLEEDGTWFSFVYKNGELIEKVPHRDKDEAEEYIAIEWIGG